ncbi:Ubiquitin supergroup [Penicillium concentricum]|uniref:Ubiquitin supergroup n=1 Tax=Penicillium concentricum TaxID=293559 RepID=A0A9W9SV91_9EURO|nr:Ubiquitin supergroup [Penicillium concentricum]KAJ5385146.1 Ubiquitin supergroup [Penicillium concentricum]
MTLLPPTLAQSTLGEKCAVYIEHITDILPVHLHSLRHQLNPVLAYLSNTSLGPIAKKLPFSPDNQPLALFAAVAISLFTITVMSWRNPLRMLRRSPSYAPASNPQVSDEDFSYISPADVADPSVDDAEPDIIALRHRGTIYPLHFRAYAIDDGVLTIGDLRDAAAKSTGAGHPDCVRLLYKGKLLKNNARTCKAEGIKQHSEVLCVVSETGAGSPSDGSDDGQTIPVTVHAPTPPPLPRPNSAGEASSPPTPSGKSKKSRNKKRNGKKSPVRPESPAPSRPPRPTSSGHSGVPAAPPNIKLMRTPLEQVTALTEWFEQEMKPICEEYIANPPSDPKKRDYEHKKLGETILTQIQIKADGIEPDGDEMARSARKALIKDTQATLNKLDAIAKL